MYASPKLLARVRAVNRANALANEWYPKLRAAVEPFAGQNVNTRGFDKKFQKAMPEMPPWSNSLRITRAGGVTSLVWWEAYVWEQVDDGPYSGGVSYKADIAVAWVNNGVVTLYEEWEPKRENWTAEEVLSLREKFKAAQKAFEDARSALRCFGEHDNY